MARTRRSALAVVEPIDPRSRCRTVRPTGHGNSTPPMRFATFAAPKVPDSDTSRPTGASPLAPGFQPRRRESDRQPCRCLWRGSSQTTKTTPRRLTILHLSQMRRTLARTFIRAFVAETAYAFNENSGKRSGSSSLYEPCPQRHKGRGRKVGKSRGKADSPRCRRSPPSLDQTGGDSAGSGARVSTSGPRSVIAIVCSK